MSQTLSSADVVTAPGAGKSIKIELYFAPSADVAKATQELTSVRQALVFLMGGFAKDPNSWSIAENGLLVASVDQDGAIHFLAAKTDNQGNERAGSIGVDLKTVSQILDNSRTGLTIDVGH